MATALPLALSVLGCASTELPMGPSVPPGLLVTIRTTGDSLDVDGYVVVIDSVPVGERFPRDTSRLVSGLSAGLHRVWLTDVAAQCRAVPPEAEIGLGPSVQEVTFTVRCAGRLSQLDDHIVFHSLRDGFHDVYAMRSDGTGLVNLTLWGGGPTAGHSVAPDGRTLSFAQLPPSYPCSFGWCLGPSYYSSRLYVMSVDRTGLRLVAENISSRPAAWSPDGTLMVFERGLSCFGGALNPLWCTSAIFVARPDGTGLTQLTDTLIAPGAREPVWSPDGTRIAFISAYARPDTLIDRGVWIMNADGSGAIQLVDQPGAIDIAWSPDGARLALATSWELLVVNADGTGLIHLPVDNGAAQAVSWSPGGTRIAFWGWTSCDGLTCERIYTINPDGTDLMELPIAISSAGSPAWSADGTRLAFHGDGEVWVINHDRTDQRNLTNHPEDDSDPTWSSRRGP